MRLQAKVFTPLIWTASDPDNQAGISLYYDSDNSGNDGTFITDGLVEGTHTSYNWDTSSLTTVTTISMPKLMMG